MDEGVDKARTMLGVANVAVRFDLLRGIAVTRAAVDAMNRAEIGGKSGGRRSETSPISFTSFNFDASFPILARADVYGTLLLAQTIQKKELSVLAQLAICYGLLNKPREAAPNKNPKGSAP